MEVDKRNALVTCGDGFSVNQCGFVSKVRLCDFISFCHRQSRYLLLITGSIFFAVIFELTCLRPSSEKSITALVLLTSAWIFAGYVKKTNCFPVVEDMVPEVEKKNLNSFPQSSTAHSEICYTVQMRVSKIFCGLPGFSLFNSPEPFENFVTVPAIAICAEPLSSEKNRFFKRAFGILFFPGLKIIFVTVRNLIQGDKNV